MNQLIAALLLFASATAAGAIGPAALAQQPVRPLQKLGSCPLGNDCVSRPNNDREVIQKTGRGCPLGWFSSGDYCVQSS